MKDDRTANRLDWDGAAARTVDSIGLWTVEGKAGNRRIQPGRGPGSKKHGMLVGIILFSGFLFAWLATGRKFFVYPVPVGGVAFIIGWLVLAIGALGFWGKN